MNDDFNTPVAVSVLFELATEVNRTRDPALARQLRSLGAVLGLLGREPRAYLQQAAGAAAEGALEPPRSKRRSPRAWPPSRRKTMRQQTGSGPNCSRPALHLKTNPAG